MSRQNRGGVEDRLGEGVHPGRSSNSPAMLMRSFVLHHLAV